MQIIAIGDVETFLLDVSTHALSNIQYICHFITSLIVYTVTSIQNFVRGEKFKNMYTYSLDIN